VQPQLAAPERFVAERIEAEDPLPLREQLVARRDVLGVGGGPVEGLNRADDRDSERVQDENRLREASSRREAVASHRPCVTDRRNARRRAP
jgi:hypothetical protein